MEPPPPSSISSSDDALLREVSNFVWDVSESGYYYNSHISVLKHPTLRFMVEFSKSRGEVILSHEYGAERPFLEAIHILVRTCPSWTIATFSFGPELSLDTLLPQLFSLMRSVPSLDYISLYGLGNLNALPTLVCENSHLKWLHLWGCIRIPRGIPDMLSSLEDAERLALCFSRKSVLQSCMVDVHSGIDAETWAVALRPFTTASKGEANVTLRHLSVGVYFSSRGIVTGSESEAIASVLRQNTTLEELTLEPDTSLFGFLNSKPGVIAQALATNRTLKRFSCHFRGGFGTFSPGTQSSDPHLITLKLSTDVVPTLGDFARDLAGVLATYVTLQHVEVEFIEVDLKPRLVWEVRSFKPPQCSEEVSTQDLLEAMMCNELREITTTTSLQSLVVGGWMLRRNCDWQMTYSGPICPGLTTEYKVQVKMRW